jgi:hypothetical protein
VSAVAAERPDLLLLATNLPDRTGWEVLCELGRRECEVPTIVMSAGQARRVLTPGPMNRHPMHCFDSARASADATCVRSTTQR